MGTVELLDGWADLDRRVVHRDGATEPLTGREAALLDVLARHAGEDCPRGLLLEEAWGLRPDTATRTIDATVRRLRRKIEPQPGTPQLLLTVHGVGYRWAPAPRPTASPDLAPGRVEPPLAHVPTDDLPLIGRDRDVEAVLSGLDATRRQLLVGPGGVGKSALARTVARQWSSRRARPAWWVSLEGVSSTDEATWRLVETLGVTARKAVAQSLQRAVARLGGSLLVLDGVDGLEEEALAALVQVLDTELLLTCRTRLEGLPAHRVVPLATEDGARLLEARLGPTRADAEALHAVVRRLGGLPLALTLAAPRVRLLGAKGMVEHLDRPQPAPERLQGWWAELSAPHRTALSALSVLPERFGWPLAEAVLGADALDTLAELVDASWLQSAEVDGERAFVWLPPLRELAVAHLTAHDNAHAVEGLSAHLATEVERRLDLRYGPQAADDARWLRGHRAALEATAARGGEHGDLLWLAVGQGRHALGDGDGATAAWARVRGPLGAFHRREPLPDDTEAVLAAAGALSLATQEGMLPAARPAAEALLAAGETGGDARAVFEACWVLAHIEATRGDWTAAAAARRRGLAAAPSSYVAAPLELVAFPLPREDVLGVEAIQTMLEVARRAADRPLELRALANGAVTALELQHVPLATQWAEEAYQLLWSVDLPVVRAGAYGNIGLVFRELGAHRRAEACLTHAWRDAPERNAVQYRSLSGLGLASTYLDAGQLGRARAMLDEVAAFAEDPRLVLRIDQLRTLCDAVDGAPQATVEQGLSALLARSEALESPSDIGRCALWLAAVDASNAADLLRRAENTFATTGESELYAIHDLLGRRGLRQVARPDVDPARFSAQVRLIRRLAAR